MARNTASSAAMRAFPPIVRAQRAPNGPTTTLFLAGAIQLPATRGINRRHIKFGLMTPIAERERSWFLAHTDIHDPRRRGRSSN